MVTQYGLGSLFETKQSQDGYTVWAPVTLWDKAELTMVTQYGLGPLLRQSRADDDHTVKDWVHSVTKQSQCFLHHSIWQNIAPLKTNFKKSWKIFITYPKQLYLKSHYDIWWLNSWTVYKCGQIYALHSWWNSFKYGVLSRMNRVSFLNQQVPYSTNAIVPQFGWDRQTMICLMLTHIHMQMIAILIFTKTPFSSPSWTLFISKFSHIIFDWCNHNSTKLFLCWWPWEAS